jgi:hypothetical protein
MKNENAAKFREWLAKEKIDQSFVIEMLHSLSMADVSMKKLEDLPAEVMDRLWKSRQRIVVVAPLYANMEKLPLSARTRYWSLFAQVIFPPQRFFHPTEH